MNLRKFINSRLEPYNTQKRIIEFLEPHNGKKLTARHESKMRAEIDETIYFRKQFGMFYIEWGNYRHNEKNPDNGSLFIAHTEKSPIIDTSAIIEKNGAYFGALEKRNETRANLTDEQIREMESVIRELVVKREELAKIQEKFDKLTEYGAPFSPDNHAIRAEFLGEE